MAPAFPPHLERPARLMAILEDAVVNAALMALGLEAATVECREMVVAHARDVEDNGTRYYT